MKKVVFLLTTLIGTLGLMSCGDDDPVQVQLDSIVKLAVDNGYNSLAAALTRADLIDDLSGDGPYTVFAPTDAQFTALLATIGQTSIDDVPVSVLSDILLSHVVDGAITSDMLSSGMVQTKSGAMIDIQVDGGITVNGLSVTTPFDVVGSNGVIHTLSGVIVPSSVAQFVDTVLEPAYFNENFTTLVSAVVKADLTNTLLTTDNLTIFAPTNQAFMDAGISVADTEKATLVDVLSYHVVTSKVLKKDVPSSTPTFGAEVAYFSLTDDGAFINGSTEITAFDIESGTGVVHVLDNVLIPSSKSLVEIATDGDDFSSLEAALLRTTTEDGENLITTLSGTGPFTIFAPTNAAFQALLDSDPTWNVLGDIPISVLVEVLKYHVVSGRVFSTDLAGALDGNDEVATYQGQSLAFDLTNLEISTTSSGSSGLDATGLNVHATNGVIHVIDAVLVPIIN